MCAFCACFIAYVCTSVITSGYGDELSYVVWYFVFFIQEESINTHAFPLYLL